MFRNRYVKRLVDSSDSKACFICYKPTAAVMVNETPNVDFFYVCESHLSDSGFAKLDPEYEKSEKIRLQKQAEVDQLRAEWELKQKSKSPDPAKDERANSPNVQTKDIQAGAPQVNTDVPQPSRPVYELNKSVFKLRLNAKRQKMQEQKTKALLGTPGLFPQAPKHKPT